jgi:hypothetical protein
MIEAQVGVKATTDCIITEIAMQIMLARTFCRQDSPSANADNPSDRILSRNEMSHIETVIFHLKRRGNRFAHILPTEGILVGVF